LGYALGSAVISIRSITSISLVAGASVLHHDNSAGANVVERYRYRDRRSSGTCAEAWASQKSFKRKDGDTDGDGGNFRGQARKNETHASTSDPDARLYRKSNNAEARLAYLGHLLMENRHGLIVDA
jgi:hypothetical protein